MGDRVITVIPADGSPSREVLAWFARGHPEMVRADAGVSIGDTLQWNGVRAVVIDMTQWPDRVDIKIRIKDSTP